MARLTPQRAILLWAVLHVGLEWISFPPREQSLGAIPGEGHFANLGAERWSRMLAPRLLSRICCPFPCPRAGLVAASLHVHEHGVGREAVPQGHRREDLEEPREAHAPVLYQVPHAGVAVVLAVVEKPQAVLAVQGHGPTAAPLDDRFVLNCVCAVRIPDAHDRKTQSQTQTQVLDY